MFTLNCIAQNSGRGKKLWQIWLSFMLHLDNTEPNTAKSFDFVTNFNFQYKVMLPCSSMTLLKFFQPMQKAWFAISDNRVAVIVFKPTPNWWEIKYDDKRERRGIP